MQEAPEATVGDLMDDNSGLSKQKVRVRQFSIRDPGLGASDDSSLERPTKGHAFANVSGYRVVTPASGLLSNLATVSPTVPSFTTCLTRSFSTFTDVIKAHTNGPATNVSF
jgi:hypothetical protein